MKQTFHRAVMIIVLIMLASVLFTTNSYAETSENETAYSQSCQSDNESSQNRRHRRPPPEAYSACEGKNAGDRAEFISPHGDRVTGTCEQEGDQLVLRPDTPPTEHRGQGGRQR